MLRGMVARIKTTAWLLLGFVMLSVLVSMTNGCQSKSVSSSLLSPTRVFEIVNDSAKVNEYIVLDLRQRMDYVRGHLVSAWWLSADSIEHKMHLLPKDKPIILYDERGKESMKVNILLLENGFKKTFVLEGGFANWIRNGFPAAIQLVMNTSNKVDLASHSISAEEVFEKIKNNDTQFVIIDIRSRVAFKDGHIKSAISIPYTPINEFVVAIEEQNFPRNKPLILYGDGETKDLKIKAADVLLRNYYSRVYLMNEDIEEWFAKSYPVDGG